MISLSLLSISIYAFLYSIYFKRGNRIDKSQDKASKATLANVSLLYGVVALGLLNWSCLKLQFTSIFEIKSWMAVLAICALLTHKVGFTQTREVLKDLKEALIRPLHFVGQINGSKTFIYITVVLGMMALASLGPINSSDTTRVYAGYPAQFLAQNRIYIDKTIIQGLLSVDNMSYLSFSIEGNQWLWRGFIHFISLTFAVTFLLETKVSRLNVFLLLIMPIYVSFLTQGKGPFLGDCAIACTYLNYKLNNRKLGISVIIGSCLLAVSIKVSSAIIAFPIAVDILISQLKEGGQIKLKRNYLSNYSYKYYLAYAMPIVLSLAAFIFKIEINGNPFFPLFTDIFNEPSAELDSFTNAIFSYKRTLLDASKLVVTFAAKDISKSIGIVTIIGVIVSLCMINAPHNGKREKEVKYVSCAQIILLILFSQGRGDYFLTPVMLGLADRESILSAINKSNKLLQAARTMIFILLSYQILLFITCMMGSIYQNIEAINNYEAAMKKYAEGFKTESIIRNHANKPVMLLESVPSHYLFRDYKFIDKYKINQCLMKNLVMRNEATINNSARAHIACMSELEAGSIVSYHDLEYQNYYDYNDSQITCESYGSVLGTRNPFRNTKKVVRICNYDGPNKISK